MTLRLPHVEVAQEGEVTLLCHHRPGVPLVVGEVQCPGGRAVEPPAKAGLVDLTAELLGECPAGWEPEAWRKRLEALAVQMDGAFGLDHWSLRFECLSEDLDTVTDLFATLLAGQALPRSQWRRVHRRRRSLAKEEFHQPAAVLPRLAAVQAVGPAHPVGHVPHPKSLARAHYEDARALGGAAMRRGGPVYAAIGGDIEPEEAFRRLRRLVQALPAGPPGRIEEPLPRPSEAPVWLMDHGSSDQAFFALGRPGIRAGDPDRVAVRLANYLIGGGGFASRLMQRVREAMGQTYGVRSQNAELRMASPFVIHSFTRAPQLADMLALIDRVLREIVEQGFTEEEVATARGHEYGSLPLQLTHPGQVLERAVEHLRSGLPVERLEADWHAAREVPRDAVHAAARRLIGDGAFRLAVIGPEKVLRPQLEPRGRIDAMPFDAPPGHWPRGAEAGGW